MTSQNTAFMWTPALTNRFHVAVHLSSNRSQMTSKCGKNKKVAHEAIAECVTDLTTSHFDVLCDLLLDRCTATWNLFVKLTSFNMSLITAVIDCACLRIHKHPDIKNAFDCASPQSDKFWPNLAIVKNSRLSRYHSPAISLYSRYLFRSFFGARGDDNPCSHSSDGFRSLITNFGISSRYNDSSR